MFLLIFSQLSDLIMAPNSMLKSHKFYPLHFELSTWGNGQSLFILFNLLAQYNGFGMEVVDQTTKLIPISFTMVRLTENHTKWWISAFIAAILSENSYMTLKCQAKSFFFMVIGINKAAESKSFSGMWTIFSAQRTQRGRWGRCLQFLSLRSMTS